MKHAILSLTLLTSACAASTPWMPISGEPAPTDTLTLVWVGHGETERLEDGVWVRRPEFDYDFSVEQHRRGDHWSSVKNMRRLHPAYDGTAGARTQTYFFRIDLGSSGADRVDLDLTTSLGRGTGKSDRDFRSAVLDIAAEGVSSLAPFDRYRITQRYGYEEGRLDETVELLKGDAPWVRNREVATLFAARRFDAAPTSR